MVQNGTLRDAAGGLAVSAGYQAAAQRFILYERRDQIVEPLNITVAEAMQAISDYRDSLDGPAVRGSKRRDSEQCILRLAGGSKCIACVTFPVTLGEPEIVWCVADILVCHNCVCLSIALSTPCSVHAILFRCDLGHSHFAACTFCPCLLACPPLLTHGHSLGSLQNVDQGLFFNGGINIVPTDGNGVTYSRTPQQVGRTLLHWQLIPHTERIPLEGIVCWGIPCGASALRIRCECRLIFY